MSSRFTPSNAIDMTKEKDWPAQLGMLDWDNTNIVFTKRTLIEFLKYTGTTVDPNFANIAKLPRYSKFGTLSAASTADQEDTLATEAAADAFKPSRRVRTAPGGPHTDIFSPEPEGDALSMAPPRPVQPEATNTTVEVPETPVEKEEYGINFSSSVKPSRRVRTAPGGESSLSNLWDDTESEAFKPTRRVRERPGGQDNIEGLF